MAKLPADRFGSAAAFADALADEQVGSPAIREGAASGRSQQWWNPLSATLAVVTVLLLGTILWAFARTSRDSGPLAYDVGLPDSAPLFMDAYTNVSVSPAGDFVVYVVGRDSITQLWYRSVRDATVRPIHGTGGGRTPVLSPDGARVAFVTSDLLVKTVAIGGGAVSTLAETISPHQLRWISRTRLLLSDENGRRLRWLDSETGQARVETVDICVNPLLLPDGDRVLCGGGATQYAHVIRLSDGSKDYIQVAIPNGTDSVFLRGAQFRLVDNSYLTYMSVDGDLRAVPFDPQTLHVGRSIALVAGVRREAYTGAGQYDLSETGTLVFAEGANADVGRLVQVRGRAPPELLPIDAAAFLRFGLSADGRMLAAVVAGVREQELRIYELSSGQRQTWIRAGNIGEPLWTPAGDRLIVTVAPPTSDRWVMLIGSPTSTAPPDTLFSGSGSGYELMAYHADDLLIGNSWGQPAHIVAVDLSVRPARMDTLMEEMLATLSPDSRWLAYHPANDLGQLFATPYPARDRRLLVGPGGGFEPDWLSATELVYWSCCFTWYRVRFDASRGPVGPPQPWHTDPRFSDTPGQSYTVTSGGALVYVQGPEQRSAAYLRVIPRWAEQMKRAVDEANQ